MDIQDVLALALVAMAAIYWLRGLARLTLGSRRDCGSGCGKCGTVQPATTNQRIRLPQI